MDIEKKVINIIADIVGVRTEEIKLDYNLAEDLGADSLDAVLIILHLEEEFGIEISDEDAERLIEEGTIDRLINYTKDKQLEKGQEND